MQHTTPSPEYLQTVYLAQQQGLSFDKAKSLADAGIDMGNQEAVRRHLQEYAAEPQPITAAQAAKAAGLPGLNWCAAMIGETRTDQLTRWFKSRPGYFRVILAGCAAIKAEMDAKIPAGQVAVRNYALAHGMTQAELDAFGGVVPITKPIMLPEDDTVRLYDYRIWEYYYRVEDGSVTLLLAPSPAAHRKQIEALQHLGKTKAHQRQLQIEKGGFIGK